MALRCGSRFRGRFRSAVGLRASLRNRVDGGLDSGGERISIVVPDPLEQLLGRDRLPVCAEQALQHRQFLAAELQAQSGAERDSSRRVEASGPPVGEFGRRTWWAPSHRPNAGDQLGELERLGQIVVGTQARAPQTRSLTVLEAVSIEDRVLTDPPPPGSGRSRRRGCRAGRGPARPRRSRLTARVQGLVAVEGDVDGHAFRRSPTATAWASTGRPRRRALSSDDHARRLNRYLISTSLEMTVVGHSQETSLFLPGVTSRISYNWSRQLDLKREQMDDGRTARAAQHPDASARPGGISPCSVRRRRGGARPAAADSKSPSVASVATTTSSPGCQYKSAPSTPPSFQPAAEPDAGAAGQSLR